MRCKEIKCDVCGKVIGEDYFRAKANRFSQKPSIVQRVCRKRGKYDICPDCVQSLFRLVKTETKRWEEENLGKSIL